MDFTAKPGEGKVLLSVILLLFIAIFFVYGYLKDSMALKDMHGAEWISADNQGRLYFVYEGSVYRLNPSDDSLDKVIVTNVKASSGDVIDIAINSTGDIFLTDPTTREIRIYSPTGTLVRRLPGHFKENAKIAVDDKRIYLADMQGNRVIALNIESGNISWTNKGYLMPDSLDVKNDIIFVSDKDKQLVRLIDAEDGAVVRNVTLNLSGYTYGSTILPLGNDEIILAQTYSRDGLLQKFSLNGKLVQTLRGPAGFSPSDLTITPTGNIVACDDTNYSFYSVNGGLISPLRSNHINELFRSDLKRKASLERSSLSSQLALIFCLIMLIGILVYYKKSSGESSRKDCSSYGKRHR
jgi:outer membrane protein assembly factor BamB